MIMNLRYYNTWNYYSWRRKWTHQSSKQKENNNSTSYIDKEQAIDPININLDETIGTFLVRWENPAKNCKTISVKKGIKDVWEKRYSTYN